MSKRLPGIGISIGLSRIFAKLLKEKRIKTDKKSPTEILVIHSRGAPYRLVNKTAQTLRQRGFNVEQYHEDRKLNAQLKYAEGKGIPWIWFPPVNVDGEDIEEEFDNNNEEPGDDGQRACFEKRLITALLEKVMRRRSLADTKA